MADRYWVGGTGTWNTTSTANWSATSGGSAGASAPTSADNVIIDANSGTGTITLGTGAVCYDLTVTATQAIALGNSGAIGFGCYGSLTFPATGSFYSNCTADFYANDANTKTITPNGKSFATTKFRGTGTFVLGSAFVSSSNTAFTGTFTLDVSASNYSFTAYGFNNIDKTAGFTFVPRQGTITIGNGGFYGFSKAYYDVVFTANSGGPISGANTFNNLTFAARTSAGVSSVSIDSNQTINGTLTAQSGNTDPTKRIFFYSDVVGTQRTITAAAIDIQCADFRDIVGAGAATWDDSTRSKYWGDCLGNSGITFNAGRTVYRKGTGNWSATQWSDTSGGTVAAQWFPLAQDSMVFDANTVTGTHTVDAGWNLGTLTMTNSTAVTLAVPSSATTSFYSDVTLSSNVTPSGGGSIVFSGQNRTQTITSAGKTWTQLIYLITSNGTIKTQDALVTSTTITINSGTLDLNNTSLTCGNIGGGLNTNAFPRGVSFGTGSIYVTTGGWGFLSGTNLSLTGSKNVYLTYSGSTGTRAIQSGAGWPNIYTTAGSDSVQPVGSFGTLDFTGFSGTLAMTYGFTVVGDLVISSSMVIGSGSTSITFGATSGTQKLTSNGKLFDCLITKGGAGTLQLQDALTLGATRTFTLTAGTLDLNNNTLTAPTAYSTSNSNIRSINFGSGGIISLPGSGTAFNASTATNLTTSGTGRIDMTSASAKTFAGGGASYPTLNQGGAGALTISGSNTFQDITNTYSATGATSVLFTSGTTNKFDAFNLTGASGAVCTLGATTTSQATLKKPTPWYMGANSTNGGNNTNLTFTAGGGIDYLSVSYIKGGTYFGIPFSEGVVQADDSTQQSAFLQTLAESITTGDSSVQASAFLQSLIESVVAGDGSTQTSAFLQSITEPLSTTDSQTTTSALLFSITEPSSVDDVRVVTAQFPLSLSEGTMVDDVRDILAGFAASQSENISTADANSQITAYHVTAAEAVEILDVLNTYGWIKINDAQYPGWIPVDSTQ